LKTFSILSLLRSSQISFSSASAAETAAEKRGEKYKYKKANIH